MGHFLTEWGPEIIQLTEGMIKGTDGKMYKGRRMPDKIDVCGPAYCDERGDELRSSVIVLSTYFSASKLTKVIVFQDRQSITTIPSLRKPDKQSSTVSSTLNMNQIFLALCNYLNTYHLIIQK